MIQLPDSENISDTLGRFLSNETICFLGTGISNIVSELGSFYFYPNGRGQRVAEVLNGRLILKEATEPVNLKTGVEVGFLAAKILKKPKVENYGLAELAGEVGMDMEEPISECPDWNAKVFSDEDVNSGVEVIYFASKILKKANIEKYGLAELAGEVGMDIKEPIGECPGWSARLFSQEQIKSVHIKPSPNETNKTNVLHGISRSKPRNLTSNGNRTCHHARTTSTRTLTHAAEDSRLPARI
uniref:Uncharacterized protein n=1 Tax=Quercus lobata TaxID=97700 RepID=A0A7N2R0X0_QUELO